MKKNIILTIVALFLLSAAAFSQTITVTPIKTTYRRPKPISPYKKTFTITRPKIRGTTPAIVKKIESTLSYEKNFDFTVNDELKEAQWLEEATYTVDYNKKGILDVEITIDGSGAYPDGSTKSIVVDAKTGNRITPNEVFINQAELAEKLRHIQKAEIKTALAEIKKDEPDAEDPESLFQEVDFKVENLKEFDINDKGIRFWYDYGFPHVIQALEPEGRYFMTWSQLKPYIKKDSLFGQFVR